MILRKFLGNTHIPHRKNTANMSPIRMQPPKEVLLPMDQHIGAPSVPVVKVGDEVKVGQIVAEASGPVSSPVYASVSGKVVRIEDCLRSNGRVVPAIRIESDGLMTAADDIVPPTVTDIPSLVDAFRRSGIVGMGGAGFPTAIKLDALKKGEIHTVIINGAECEPYITSDARMMVDHPDLIYDGIKLIRSVAPSLKSFYVGIEVNKPECIKAMREITRDDGAVTILPLPLRYPQGAEKVLIYNATGMKVPENKLPGDIGVMVMNVTTLATFAQFVKTGMPLVERCVTVDGSDVGEPKNIIAPIGTSIGDMIEFAGGIVQEPCKIIMGGPMTGRAAYSLSEPIVKTTNAIVVLNEKDTAPKRMTECIHCGRCVEACPHSLNPAALSKALRIDNVDDRMARLEDGRVNLCMECGCCSYVCPASRPLIENIRVAKNSLRDYKAHKASLK